MKTIRTHTPGPWRIGDAGNTVFGPKTDRPSPQTIATLGVIDHAANARLIAAAPEMLDALRAVWAEADGDWKSEHPTAALVRAAIAKAEGGR